MARRKTMPDLVRAKYELAERLSALRAELFGDRGGPEMARRLGLPIRTWYNYESGVTVPAEVVLRVIELTSVEPMWLLYGTGPKFRQPDSERPGGVVGPVPSVGALLRTALELLEQRDRSRPAAGRHPAGEPSAAGTGAADDVVMIGVEPTKDASDHATESPEYVAARGEWLEAERNCRCIRVEGNAMAPIIADGAYVAFAETEDQVEDLDGKIVVAWINDRPLVRWFKLHGRFGLLRAENPSTEPIQIVIDLEEPPERLRVRRVLWINTPH